ncbi:uncharacterized protein METZ01_LOCUS197408, partial [marine metagenome]
QKIYLTCFECYLKNNLTIIKSTTTKNTNIRMKRFN